MRWGLDLSNALAFAAALLAASAGAFAITPGASPSVVRPTIASPRPHSTQPLYDARGVIVPLRPYRRIASATLLADRVLADLLEPERVVAFSRYAREGRDGHRYAGKPLLGVREGLERILTLAPDLLLVSELFDASYAARLEERGIVLFDLGPMRGVSSLLTAIERIGLLAGEPERAADYAARLERRLAAVARDGKRPPYSRALYLSRYGDRLFGGAGETSYHDVLAYAGLRDVAAEAGLTGWPDLPPERVLALDPELIVTRVGSGAAICRFPGLSSLRPCSGRGRIVELEGALLDDPGPGMLDAAEALRAGALAR